MKSSERRVIGRSACRLPSFHFTSDGGGTGLVIVTTYRRTCDRCINPFRVTASVSGLGTRSACRLPSFHFTSVSVWGLVKSVNIVGLITSVKKMGGGTSSAFGVWARVPEVRVWGLRFIV